MGDKLNQLKKHKLEEEIIGNCRAVRIIGFVLFWLTNLQVWKRAKPSSSNEESFVRFKSGVSGSIEANWLATGCKMKHDFEIYGTKGAIRFSQERLNELYLFSLSDKKNIIHYSFKFR